MTQAVCVRCGGAKFGAFMRCRTCGFVPMSLEDRAKSVILSDQVLDSHRLSAASESLKAGKSISFDRSLVAQWMQALEESTGDLKMPFGRVALVYSPFVIALVLVLILAGITVYLKCFGP